MNSALKQDGTINAVPESRRTGQGRGASVTPFEIRPEPWRVLRLYIWLALGLTAGPVLVGLYAGVAGFVLTKIPAGEIFDRCVELVGYAPLIGLVVVLLGLPAAWVILRDYRRDAWWVDAGGVSIRRDGVEQRRITWDEVDAVRVSLNGPLLLLKDRSREGEQLLFVRRDHSVRLHRCWSRNRMVDRGDDPA